MQLEVLMVIREQWLLSQAKSWCKLKGYNFIKHKMVEQTLKLITEYDYKVWIIEFTPAPKTKKRCVEVEVVLNDRYNNFVERATWEYYNETMEGAYEDTID
tara:strand:+ start:190 stop:492 length:303 start_codon:yes stop_codon:yes gene_type:complete